MRPTHFKDKKIDMNNSIWGNFKMSSVGSLCSKVLCFLKPYQLVCLLDDQPKALSLFHLLITLRQF